MASWRTFEVEAPELAATVGACFARGKHCTLATLRADGSPRISGTEAEFADGEVWLGSMPGAMKALDLRRDGRFALHSPTIDPPEDSPSDWAGEAKLAGRAVEIDDPVWDNPAHAGSHRFRLDVTEVVFTRVEGDELVVESWHEGRGARTTRRH